MIKTVSGQFDGSKLKNRERMLFVSASAFGILREELIKNIGLNRMKGFLLRYGKEMGVNDAKKVIAQNTSIDTQLRQGPIYHQLNGYIKSIIYKAEFKFDQGKSVVSAQGQGKWFGSYEAEQHITRLGPSNTPVCYMNVGYISGYLSTVCNHPVIAKEVSCVGMGDDVCEWVIKSKGLWGDEILDELQYYYQTPIVQELEYTYEQLIEERNYLAKVANLHHKLTEEVINGNNLQAITEIVYDSVRIPCIIYDLDIRPIAYSGMSAGELMELEKELANLRGGINTNHLIAVKNRYSNEPLLIRTEHKKCLSIPVFVKGNQVAYCAFVYPQNHNIKQDTDLMILERIANAASLFLLNEVTKFEAFERMKGDFLEKLLTKQYESREDILKRGVYVNIDLTLPYYIVVLEYHHRHYKQMGQEYLLYELILETAFQYFKEQNRNVIVGQREGRIIFLVTKEVVNKSDINKVFYHFISFLEETFDNCYFKVGISSEGEQIEYVSRYYDEALLALRMATTKKVVSFDSLGIVGALLSTANIEVIRSLAIQMLGPIYNNEPQNKRLIKTLYVFLANGGRLEQTMRDLSLSMGGLLYRLKKIEDALKRDLRDPEDSHQLFLILEALIALGELNIEAEV